jgi:hypothetical protein
MIGFASRYEDMQELLAQVMLLNSETSDRSAEPDADALPVRLPGAVDDGEHGLHLVGIHLRCFHDFLTAEPGVLRAGPQSEARASSPIA